MAPRVLERRIDAARVVGVQSLLSLGVPCAGVRPSAEALIVLQPPPGLGHPGLVLLGRRLAADHAGVLGLLPVFALRPEGAVAPGAALGVQGPEHAVGRPVLDEVLQGQPIRRPVRLRGRGGLLRVREDPPQFRQARVQVRQFV